MNTGYKSGRRIDSSATAHAARVGNDSAGAGAGADAGAWGTALERLPVPACIVDSELGIAGANAALGKLLGVAPSWLAGSDLRGIADGGLAARMSSIFTEADRVVSGRARCALKGRAGPPVTMEASLRILPAAAEGSRFAIVTFRPAGAGRIPSARSRVYPVGIVRLFEAVPVGMALLDDDGWFADANPSLAAMLGCRREDLVGHPLHAFTHPDDVAQTVSLSSSLRRGALPSYQFQKRYLASDGRVVWANVHVAAVQPETGEGIRAFAIIEDITRFKEKELSLADRMAEQRRALIRETHHRIKNSLQGIAGLLALHGRQYPESEATIRLAIERIQSIALVHGMCTTSGSDIPNCCDVTVGIAEAMKEQYGRRLATTVCGEATPVSIDPDELVPYALILTELLTNAMKHGRCGPDPVVLEVIRGAGTVTVSIVNPGTSLAAGFDFRRGLGTGNGLSLVKSLLPPRGMELSLFDVEDRVVTRIVLSAPIVGVGPGRAGP